MNADWWLLGFLAGLGVGAAGLYPPALVVAVGAAAYSAWRWRHRPAPQHYYGLTEDFSDTWRRKP